MFVGKEILKAQLHTHDIFLIEYLSVSQNAKVRFVGGFVILGSPYSFTVVQLTLETLPYGINKNTTKSEKLGSNNIKYAFIMIAQLSMRNVETFEENQISVLFKMVGQSPIDF